MFGSKLPSMSLSASTITVLAAVAITVLKFLVLPSKANFVFARHGAVSGRAVYEGLKARGVLVRHFQKPRIEEFCRITIGSPAQNDALLAALDELLDECKM